MENRYQLNKELAQMLKGGVIMDVTTPEQARIAEQAGACAVMALERIPADIRAAGGVSRLKSTTLTRVKCFLRQMMYITLTRPSSRYRLYAVRAIWARRCAALRRAHP